MWHEERLLVDGELVAAEGGRTFPTINPATEEVLGTAADATVGDAERAIAAARRAFDTTNWSRDRDFRVQCLRQFVAGLRTHLEDLRALTVAEIGAPVSLTQGPHLDATLNIVEWYADLLAKYEFVEDLGVAEAFGALHHRWIEREAAGVVAAISAYNYPNQLNLAKLAPALAAGCTVVLKGAPDAPWLALALGKLIAEETDVPPGVVNVLASSEVAVGEALTTNPLVDMITFTGSTAVGRQIMAAASATLKKCFCSVGGSEKKDSALGSSAASLKRFEPAPKGRTRSPGERSCANSARGTGNTGAPAVSKQISTRIGKPHCESD